MATAAEIIEELLALEASGATVPDRELLVVLRSTLESGYEGRGLPPNEMNAEAQQVTTDLLAVVGEAEATEGKSAADVAGGEKAAFSMDTALIVAGCAAAIALVAVGVAVVVVRRARNERAEKTADQRKTTEEIASGARPAVEAFV